MAFQRPSVDRATIWHLPRMLATHKRAFATDPTSNYLMDEEVGGSALRTRLLNLCHRLFIVAITAHFLWQRENYQLDGGLAYITWNPASSAPPPPSRAYRLITGLWKRAKSLLCTPEQKRRDVELGAKMGEAQESVLGGKAHEFMCLNVLAADPAVHGRGYGRSLMELACATADSQGRKVWLTSTNVQNTRFYEASGFVSMQDIVLGDENVSWKREPVVVKFMVREPQTKRTA